MKYLTDYIPATDTTEFENSMLAIIGDDASIPPVIVSGAKYYKCASVDTTTRTWSGYELVLTDGVYSVSETLTDGLGYTSKVPAAENYYTEDGLIQLLPYMGWKAPESGLVFYAPLSSVEDTVAATGEELTFVEATSSVQDTIPCVAFNAGRMYCSGANAPTGSSPRTVSLWVKQMQTVNMVPIGGYGANNSAGKNQFFACRLFNNSIGIWGDDADWNSSFTFAQTVWHHYLWLNDGSTDRIYVDGVLAVERSYTRNTDNAYIFIGATGYESNVNQYATAFRIYNRALTQEEITTLASEFTPITT